MPAPLSLDLRRRIIAAKLKGDTEAGYQSTNLSIQIWSLNCGLFTVPQGVTLPRPNSGVRKPALSSEQLEQIRAAIGEQPDIMLQELKDKLSLPVSLPALSKTIRGELELYYKKNNIPRGTASGRGQNKARGMEVRTARNGY